MGTDSAQVFIVDDHEPTRQVLHRLMESAGLSAKAYAGAVEFLAELDAQAHACLVLDHQMPGMTGLELIRHLRSRAVDMPVVVVTGHGDVFTAVECMKLGVSDVMPKPVDDVLLVEKVQHALRVHAGHRQTLAEMADIRGRLAALTDRERELLEMLVAGRSSKQIAFELGLSLKTVENHRSHLLTKMQAANVADLVRMSVTARQS